MSVGRLGLGTLALVVAWVAGAASAGAVGWTIDSVPPPTRPQALVDLIAGISCPTSRVCVAVGEGPDGPLVERWNGRRWKRQRARFGDDAPTAVSCSSAKACTVVGGGEFALRWNGSRWHRQRMPGRQDLHLDLADVSCPAARSCFAIGVDDDGGSVEIPVIERWHGRRWSLTRLRLSRSLDSLSCASATSCVAVGYGGPRSTLVERWNGSRWSLQRISSPHNISLRLVSCPTATACLALGDEGAERWDGRRWSRTRAPRLGKSIFLDALSCSRPKACIAIGTSGTRTGPERLLAERWNGRRWSLQRPPTPQNVGTEDDGLAGADVSCPSRRTCVAAWSVLIGGSPPPVTERLRRGKWSRLRLPSRSVPTGAAFTAVSCASSSACTAVGGGTQPQAGFVERFDGAGWSIQKAPFAADLAAVSCPSITACEAVGHTGLVGDPSPKFAAHAFATGWDGVSWRTQRAITPARGAALTGLSCQAAASCIAVGTAYPHNTTRTLAERWDGAAWSVQSAPLPMGAVRAQLGRVSCASTTDCMAVGDYAVDENHTRPLAEHWDGASWSPQALPLPLGATSGALGGVSCASPTTCVAVGSVSDPDNPTSSALAERWDGARWTAELIPAGRNVFLSPVSCTSASACMSVGVAAPSDGTRSPVAALWNGTAWTLQRPPAPPRARTTELDDVDCTAAAACVAVGSTNSASGDTVPLVERYG